jgi:hypothetical protein
MERLNLTLDEITSRALAKHAARVKRPRATVARELILEALQQRDLREQRLQLARDYVAGREDASEVLEDLECLQIEVLGDEET